jgi:hypothetical protein
MPTTKKNPKPANGDPADYSGLPRIFQKTLRIFDRVPKSELRAMPTDLSKNADHYLYGSPKV